MLKTQQIAGMNICYGHYSLDYFLDSMARLGYRSIELYGAAPHCYLLDLIDGGLAQLRRRIADRGLRLVCYTPDQCRYPTNIASADPWARRRSVAVLEREIHACAELECPLMLVTPGYGYRDRPVEEAWAVMVDSLSRLAETARREGVVLALEPLREDETNLVTTLPLLGRALEEVGSPALQGMLDTSPMYFAGESIQDYFNVLGDRLRHVHLIDGAPSGHLAWGEGIFPLEEYMQTLRRNGYAHAVTMELTAAQYNADPEPAMRRCLEALCPYLEG